MLNRPLVLKAHQLAESGLPLIELRRLNDACGVRVLKDVPPSAAPLAHAFLDRAAREYGLPQPEPVA